MGSRHGDKWVSKAVSFLPNKIFKSFSHSQLNNSILSLSFRVDHHRYIYIESICNTYIVELYNICHGNPSTSINHLTKKPIIYVNLFEIIINNPIIEFQMLSFLNRWYQFSCQQTTHYIYIYIMIYILINKSNLILLT